MIDEITHCLRCQEPLRSQLSWQQIWSFTTIDWPSCCESCQSKFKKCATKGVCRYCQHPLIKADETICFDCQQWLKLYDEHYLDHRSIFEYNDFFKDWIRDYKYLGDLRQAQVMVPIMKEYYHQYSNYTWTYLPSSPQNYKKRGFNQIQVLFEKAGIPYQELFDYNINQLGQSQAKKNKTERLNLVQPFIINKEKLETKNILIMDDVYTTGTTLIRAKELLFQHSIERCLSITLARDSLI